MYKVISLSPFGEELNDDALSVPIDKIYCDLDIVKIKGKRQTEHPTGPTRRLNSYSEMFADTEIKNIVIKGEGGTGKSTWCKRLLHAWCQVQRRELGMEGASDEANSDMEESLKRFYYLFYVTLRDVKHQSPLKDILLSAGLDRLSIKKNVCELILANNSENVLILSDGFDEYPFTLDCQGLGHSTIVMTTRPWKYDVLLSKDNNFKVDAVSEIRGLTYRGIRELSRKVIVSYNKQSPDMGLNGSDAEEQTDIYLDDIKSAELSGSIRIPLILIITVLTWLENKKSLSKSLTCNILGLLKVIFQRGKRKLSQTNEQALKRAEQEKKEPSAFHEGLTAKYKFMCDNQVLLQHLGRLAYKGLTDQQKVLSLVFSEDELHEFLASEELEICYKLGLLTGSTVTTSLLKPPQVSVSFYHKLFQELFAAIGIISDSDTLSEFTKMLTSLRAVSEMENVILFITALNPCIGSDLSKHIAGLAETDDSACEYRRQGASSYILMNYMEQGTTVEKYSELIFKCMFEWDSIHDRKEQKPFYLTDLIIETDFDRKLHLCTYLSGKQLKSLRVEVGSSESVNIKQMFSQLAKLTAEAAPLQFLYIDLHLVKQKDINTTTTTNFDLTESVHLETVLIKGITLSNGQNCLGLTFGQTVQLKTMDIENAIINMLYLQNITWMELENVKLKEITLPTRLARLEHVKLSSVTMPESSWNSFFPSVQSKFLIQLTLRNLDIDDITINLENCSGPEGLLLEDVKVGEIRLLTRPRNLDTDDITINLENSSRLEGLLLEDVKVREIRLPTRLARQEHVLLSSVTMPESSWNSLFPSVQSKFLIQLTLKNLNIDDITINLENCSGLEWLVLEDVKVREIRLPTGLEKLCSVNLQSVTMPELSWNSFFSSLQSKPQIELILQNLNIDNITINLENSTGLQKLELEDVKVREIRLQTGLEKLCSVRLQSVTMPESSWDSFSQSLQSIPVIRLTLKNLNIDKIKLHNCERLEYLVICNMKLAEIHILNCKRLEHLEISNMKLAEIHISGTERLETITAKEVALPESQASSFFNQVLLSTELRHLTMKDISIGEETVQFDRWNHGLKMFMDWRRYLIQLDRWYPDFQSPAWPYFEENDIKIQLENVTMSKESYECLCTLLETVKINENQVTKHSTDRGLLNVTFFVEKKCDR